MVARTGDGRASSSSHLDPVFTKITRRSSRYQKDMMIHLLNPRRRSTVDETSRPRLMIEKRVFLGRRGAATRAAADDRRLIKDRLNIKVGEERL